MKRSHLCTALILLFSQAAWSASIAGGLIEFKGMINASTCKIDSPYIRVNTECNNKSTKASGDSYKNTTPPHVVRIRQLSQHHYINDIVYR